MVDFKKLSAKLQAHLTPPDAESKVAPAEGATCRECVRLAEYMIENQGEQIPMCASCANHNVANRGASYMRKADAAAPAASLPDLLPGHWETPAGAEMAREYATQTRAQISGGALTDMEVAFSTAMIRRNDTNFEADLAIAKDRIRWLSVQLALANASKADLVEQLALALPYVESALQSRGYKIEAVTIRTKSIREAIAKAAGGK